MIKQKQKQKTFFGEEIRLKTLKQYNNPLSKLDKHINWEVFKRILENVLISSGPV